MATSKRRLPKAIEGFGREVRNFTRELTDGVNLLKRTMDYGPSAGALEFKDTLADLEDEVAELTQQVQHLERFTVDAISFEELLGHCMSVYQSNHAAVQQLETHLKQYGYQSQGQLLAPEDPMLLVKAQADEDDESGGEEGSEEEEEDVGVMAAPTGKAAAVRMGNAPTTPHVLSREASARLRNRVATPGMHLRAAFDDEEEEDEEEEEDDDAAFEAATAAISGASKPLTAPVTRSVRQHTPASKLGTYADGSEDGDEEDSELMDALASLPRKTGQAVPARVSRDENVDPRVNVAAGPQLAGSKAVKDGAPGAAAAGREPGTARKSARKQPRDRESLDSTPEAFMMSPSFAALQAKYGAAGEDGITGDAGAGAGAAQMGVQAFGDLESDDEDLDADTPVGLLPQQAGRQGGVGAGLSQKLGGLSLGQERSSFQQAQLQCPSHEDDTCALYAQLIRSKDVPSSITAAAAHRAASAMTRAAAAAAVIPAAGAGAGVSAAGENDNSRNGLNGAHTHQGLASQLSNLEDMWVSSGQAALTPPRGSKGASSGAAGAGAGARSDVLQPAASKTSAVAGAPAAAVTKQASHSSAAAAALISNTSNNNTSFAFPQPAVAAPAALHGQADLAKAAGAATCKPLTTTPAWPFTSKATGSSTTANLMSGGSTASIPSVPPLTSGPATAATPHDAALLAKYGSGSSTASFTPSLGLSSQNLSPGTAQLLSRVFANRAPPTAGGGAPSGSAFASGLGTVPVAQPSMPQASGLAASVAAPAPAPAPAAGSVMKSQAYSAAPAAPVAPTSRPAAAAAAVVATAAAPATAPAPAAAAATSGGARAIEQQEYSCLPSFLRSQLPLEQLNAALTGMAGLGKPQLTMDDLGALGHGPKAKVVVNVLVKLGRMEMAGSGAFSLK